jgi:5'(3')-deoxyribonucleotidase
MQVNQIVNDPPHLYLDMDGVQSDFFTAWANIAGKNLYKDIGDRAAREASIDQLNQRGPEFIQEFFANLPVMPGGTLLVRWLTDHDIAFTILSAPLRGNHDASIAGKLQWLDKHNPGTAGAAIFTGMKERFANRKGVPAILIDDFKQNVKRWREAGGQAILYREHSVDNVIQQLAEIYQI